MLLVRVVVVDTMALGFMVVGALGFAVEAEGWHEGFVACKCEFLVVDWFAVDSVCWRGGTGCCHCANRRRFLLVLSPT